MVNFDETQNNGWTDTSINNTVTHIWAYAITASGLSWSILGPIGSWSMLPVQICLLITDTA
jgi:hypothetical protein